jgi:hypothetical protein
METKKIVVRAGVPQPSGALVNAAYEAGIPVLFSANAFAKNSKQPSSIGPFRLSPTSNFGGFNLKAARNLPPDMDAALDSAGFVAANRYGCYRWTVSDFYDLVEARDWAWHAAMDFCMEPEVTGSQLVRTIRLQATAQGYFECVNEANRRGAQMPMPVLQGWVPDDYLKCIDLMAIQDWPDLIGIGSVCRRHLGGEDGIVNIVETLDRVLPKNTKFHLFGVKGGAVKQFGSHPRFQSIDSMAWDFGVRCASRTGRTQSMRSAAMLSWQRAQADIEPVPWVQKIDFLRSVESSHMPSSMERIIENAVVSWHYDNINDHGYEALSRDCQNEAKMLILKVKHMGLESIKESDDSVENAVYEALTA